MTIRNMAGLVKRYMSVLEDLKILASVKQNERISTQYGLRIESHADVTQSIRRWIYGENRILNINTVSNIFERSFILFDDLSKNIQDENELNNNINQHIKRIIHRLYNNIVNAKNGMVNLKVTYEQDKSIVSKIDSLNEKVDDYLLSVRDIPSIRCMFLH